MTAISADTPLRPSDRVNTVEALSSEWTKIRTVQSTFWTLLTTLIVSVGISALLAIALRATWDDMKAEDKATFDAASYGLAGLNLGMIALGVLGVMVISAEYSTGMIRTSLTAVPNRTRLFLAKAGMLAIISFIVGEITAFTSFFVAQSIFLTKDIHTSVTDEGVLRAIIGGGLYLTAIALLAFGIGAILRHTAGAITTVLGVLFVLPIIGSFLPGSWGDKVNEYLPSSAGGAIMSTRPADDMLDPWAGFGVFLLYTAIVLVAAAFLFERRDA